jgi:AbiJ N-terminal domain 4
MTMRFSQRVGAKPPFRSGLNEATQELRTRAWNLFYPIVIPDGEGSDWGTYRANAKVIWNHLHWTTDKIPHYASDGREKLKDYWFSSDWASFFDLFERCVQILADEQRRLYREPAKLYETVNSVLEQQGCAYRFISEVLAPITNPLAMAEVKTASQCAIESVSTHIIEALRQLPPNPEASPRNSVKESISAVEAALKHLTGQPAARVDSPRTGSVLRVHEWARRHPTRSCR